MRVIIEESAVADIDGRAVCVAKDSAQGARSIVEKILQTIERLTLFPEMGHKGRDQGTYERAYRIRRTSWSTKSVRSRARFL